MGSNLEMINLLFEVTAEVVESGGWDDLICEPRSQPVEGEDGVQEKMGINCGLFHVFYRVLFL